MVDALLHHQLQGVDEGRAAGHRDDVAAGGVDGGPPGRGISDQQVPALEQGDAAPVLVDDGVGAVAARGHHRLRLVDRRSGRDRHDVAGHDVADQRGPQDVDVQLAAHPHAPPGELLRHAPGVGNESAKTPKR